VQGTAQGFTHNDLARKCPGNITRSQHLKSDLPTDPHLNLKPALPAQSLETHFKWQIAKLNTKLNTTVILPQIVIKVTATQRI